MNGFGDFLHEFITLGVILYQKIYGDCDHQTDQSDDEGIRDQIE
jgi:hypothetical protein